MSCILQILKKKYLLLKEILHKEFVTFNPIKFQWCECGTSLTCSGWSQNRQQCTHFCERENFYKMVY